MSVETDGLINNIIDQIKEAQIKLGYVRENMRFYYPLSSMNVMLKTDFEKIDELICEINRNEEFKATDIGELEFRLSGDRVEITVPPKGVEFVYRNVPASSFLEDIIELFATHHSINIEDVCSIFCKYSDEYVCEKMNEGEDFDYVIYFKDKSIDEYYYCIKREMGHTIYHRFTKEDFEGLIK